MNKLEREKCCRILAKSLPALRKRIGISQAQLANVLNISRQTVANIENGRTDMKWQLFLAIMFLLYSNENYKALSKIIDLPYEDLKRFLSGKEIQ